MATSGKERIAILGGGVGALSAAFYLTELPDAAERFEITVYQQGWRLGGKCASGHDMRPGYGHRIYEHGLHIFAGFYDQAFDLLRRAYDVLERPEDHPNQTVWDAFTSQDTIALVDRSQPDDPELMWYMDFPPNDETPGDDLVIPPVMTMVQRLVSLLIKGGPPPRQATPGSSQGAVEWPVERCWTWLKAFVGREIDELEDAAIALMMREVSFVLEQHMLAVNSHDWPEAWKLEAERFLLSAFLVQTVIDGIVEDHVHQGGYDQLDHEEFSDWLRRHAIAVAKTQSPLWGTPEKRADQLVAWTPIASLYDYVFGYGDSGDVTKPNFGAGTALRSGFLMISYRGHFFWKMRGAMGDVVIAPLYLALRRRGVKFRFFSRISALNIDSHQPVVASVDYVQQADVAAADGEYDPLIEVPIPGWPEHLPLEGWPDQPLWPQLKDGARYKAAGRDFEAEHADAPVASDVTRQLRLGEDYDKLVLGISVGGLKQVCSSFPARLPASKWGPMFETLSLTRTCAMQLWFNRTQDDLGSRGSDRTLTGADQPYSSWSDMSHLLSRETWAGQTRPLSIAYFCGQIQGPENGEAANQKARKEAEAWLKDDSKIYWRRATSSASPYSLDPKLLYDPDPGGAGDVLSRQYIRANCSPSDLYVQSPKDSLFHRMDANESGLENLFLAGDWTHNGVNSGCAESAARSGYRCAQAIGGKLPPLPSN